MTPVARRCRRRPTTSPWCSCGSSRRTRWGRTSGWGLTTSRWRRADRVWAARAGAGTGATRARPPAAFGPLPGPSPSPPSGPSPSPMPAPATVFSDLSLSPHTFKAARSGPAVSRTGRAGAALRFRLSRPAAVEFRVTSSRLPGPPSREEGEPATGGPPGTRSARPARDRPLLGPGPSRPQPAPLQRKAARPSAAVRVLPLDRPRDRPGRSRVGPESVGFRIR